MQTISLFNANWLPVPVFGQDPSRGFHLYRVYLSPLNSQLTLHLVIVFNISTRRSTLLPVLAKQMI